MGSQVPILGWVTGKAEITAPVDCCDLPAQLDAIYNNVAMRCFIIFFDFSLLDEVVGDKKEPSV